jgi:hypothetical protein
MKFNGVHLLFKRIFSDFVHLIGLLLLLQIQIYS